MVIKATIIKVLFAEMYVSVVFVIRGLYSAVSLNLVKEQRFIRMVYYYVCTLAAVACHVQTCHAQTRVHVNSLRNCATLRRLQHLIGASFSSSLAF